MKRVRLKLTPHEPGVPLLTAEDVVTSAKTLAAAEALRRRAVRMARQQLRANGIRLLPDP